jgi:carotenoid cleavage dioxygenase
MGVMPRYGNVNEMRWFKGPKGVSAFHFVNAFNEGDTVHIDICLTSTNAFPFMHRPDDPFNPMTMTGGLTRWTVNMADPNAELQSRVIGPPGDLPRLRDCDQGRGYQHVWLPTYDPRIGPPVSGGPVGSCFNALLYVDVTTGQVLDAMTRGPGHAFNEPVHVPSKTPGHAGWILAVIDREIDFEHHVSELVILKADAISQPPVAVVKMPVALRPQVHGWWVSGEELEKSKLR